MIFNKLLELFSKLKKSSNVSQANSFYESQLVKYKKPMPANNAADILKQIFGNPPYKDFCIAGGSVRLFWNNSVLGESDIDIWFFDQQTGMQIIKDLELKIVNMRGFSNTRIYKTDNAVTYTFLCKEITYKIQLIKNGFYPTVDSLWNSFDFTVCQFASDGKTLYASECAVTDMKDKKLCLVNDSGQIKLPRFIKYCYYGYIPTQQLLTRIKEEKLKDLKNDNLISSLEDWDVDY